jgi:hypothetical protein
MIIKRSTAKIHKVLEVDLTPEELEDLKKQAKRTPQDKNIEGSK